jgi:hypothetical protein
MKSPVACLAVFAAAAASFCPAEAGGRGVPEVKALRQLQRAAPGGPVPEAPEISAAAIRIQEAVPAEWVQVSQDRPRCHARACPAPGAAREAADAAGRRRRRGLEARLTNPYPGIAIRTLVSLGREEVDCREFIMEGCYFSSLEDERDFSYEWTRSVEGAAVVWSVANPRGGLAWDRPHRWIGTPGRDGKRDWSFDERGALAWDARAGRPADPAAIPCVIKRLDHWQQMMEERGGDRITVSNLEHTFPRQDTDE